MMGRIEGLKVRKAKFLIAARHPKQRPEMMSRKQGYGMEPLVATVPCRFHVTARQRLVKTLVSRAHEIWKDTASSITASKQAV